ncbi:MAG: 1-acyl-sn-glycerol-3-phosphate acyltransferase [Armatimonadetes bacterium]|nr:1-acyl-sn-glycerol-3-phosphate acyltransferase [Armatimonadota bacterium]
MSVVPKAHPTWFAFCRWFTRVFFFRLGGGFDSTGTENIPMTGPVIFAPIHVSHVDPPAVACGCKRRLRFMAKADLFDHKFFGGLIRSLGAFPVNRGEGDTESVKVTIALLNSGEAVLVFPEGTRGDGKTMLPVQRGVSMLAKKTNAQVVPVALIGTVKRWPKGASKPKRSKVLVVYGKPFTYAEVCQDSNEKKNRETFARVLADRIASLCNEHGFMIKSGETSSDQTEVSHPESQPAP